MAEFGVAADYPELRQRLGLPSREELLARRKQPAADDFSDSEMVPLSTWLPKETPEPDAGTSDWTRLGRAVGSIPQRAGQLAGAGIQSLAQGLETLATQQPDQSVQVPDLPTTFAGVKSFAEAHPGSPVQGTAAGMNWVGSLLRGIDVVKDPGLNLDYLSQSTGVMDAVRRGGVAGIGTLIQSVPDMVAATTAFPAYLTNYIADTTKNHAEARTGDKNATPNAEDYAHGFLFGAPSAVLQQFGAEVMLKNMAPGFIKTLAEGLASSGNKILSKIPGVGASTGRMMGALKNALTTGGLEALTEFPQNMLDYFGATYGTDKFSWDEAWRQGIEGGVLAGLSGLIGGGAHGATFPHSIGGGDATKDKKLPDAVTGLLGPDTEAALGTPPGAPPGGPARVYPDEIKGPPGTQGELHEPGARLTPPVRALPVLGPDPATHPLSEVGTVVDPSQLQLGDVAPAQGTLALGDRASGVGSERGLLDLYRNQTARRPVSGAGPLAETGTISDPNQPSMLSPDVVAAVAAHNAMPESARPEQGEMFRAEQVGQNAPIGRLTRPGPEPAVHPLDETGTIVDPAQRSALNPLGGLRDPNALDPGFLGREAQRRLAALRAQPASSVPRPTDELAASAAPTPAPMPTPELVNAPTAPLDRLVPPTASTAVFSPTTAEATAQPVTPAEVPVPVAKGPLAEQAKLRLNQPVGPITAPTRGVAPTAPTAMTGQRGPAAGRPAPTQRPAAPPRPVTEPVQAQPQGPQITIGPQQGRLFPATPGRVGATVALRGLAADSNKAGAANVLPELRRRLALIDRNTPGVDMAVLERAAGIEPGGMQKQFAALEKLHRTATEEGAAPAKRGRPRAGPTEPVSRMRPPGADNKLAPVTVAGHVLHPETSPQSFLHRITNDTTSEVSKFLAPIAEKLLSLGTVNDVPIKYVDGLIESDEALGLYHHYGHRIDIDSSLTGGERDIVLMHELVHAATVHAINNNEALHNELEDIRHHLQAMIGPDHPLADLVSLMTENPRELVTYAMTHPNAQELLSRVPYGKTNLWTKIKDFIAKALGLQPQDRTALDHIMSLGVQAMHEQAIARAKAEMTRGAPGSYANNVQRQARQMAGYTTAVTNPRPHPLGTQVDRGRGHAVIQARLGREMPADLRDALQAGQRDHAWANFDHTKLADGSLVLPARNLSVLYDKPPSVGADEVLRARPGALTKGLLSTDPFARAEASKGVFNRLRRLIDSPGERTREGVAMIQSVPQLVQWYKKHFGDGPNPLVKWMESFDERRRHEGQLREKANDIQQQHNDLPEDQQTTLAVVAQFSTMKGVDPSRPTEPYTVTAADNALTKSNKERGNRAWQRARAAYQTMSPEAQQVFANQRDFMKASFGERRKLLLQQILEPRGVDVSRITPTTPLSEVEQMFKDARADPSKAPSKAERNIIRLVRATYSDIPIYFPLRRSGRYYTSVESKETQTYANPQDHLGDTARQDDPTLVDSKILKPGTAADPTTHVEYTYRDVAFHDTRQEGRDYLKQLKAENPSLRDAVTEEPTLRRAEHGGHGLPVQTLVSHLVQNLGEGTQEARDATDTVLAMLPELSHWKARMRRHNIPGVKPEQFRAAMAREMKNLSRQEAILKYSKDLAGHMKEMRDQQRVVNRAGKADQASNMNILIGQLERLQELERQLPAGPAKAMFDRAIGTLGFVSYLASPAFAVVNMSQVLTNTLPTLGGRHGYVDATKALHEASSAIHRKGLIARSAVSSVLGLKALARLASDRIKPDEKLRKIEDTIAKNIAASSIPYKDDVLRLMDDLVRRGRAGETQAQELLHTAREGTGFSKTLNDSLEIAREMAQATETTNRVMTGIASYLLERQNGADHKTASQQAIDDIDLTQFAYDPEYRSEAFRRLPRFMTQFKEYPLSTYNLLAQHFVNAFAKGKTPEERAQGRKALAGMALAYSVMGGVMAPLWNEPTRMFVNLLFYLWNMMTGEDINPEDEMRKWLRDTASEMGGSPWVGEAVVGGLPRLAGVDLSNRISLSQLLLPSSVRGTTPADKVGSALGSFFGGPTLYNGAINALTALQDPSFANVLSALPFVPKTIQDIAKAHRLHDTGMTDSSGDTLIAPQDIDAYQLMVQGLGFTPAALARMREKRGAVFRLQHAEADRRDALVQEYRNADPTDRSSVVDRIKLFNQRKPVQPITNRTLVNSLKAKAIREQQIRHVGGIALPQKQLPLIERAAGTMP